MTSPAVCFEACNDTYVLAQKLGKSSELCKQGSDFNDALDSCKQCLQANDASDSEFQKAIQQYISFCEGEWDSGELSSALSIASVYGYTMVPISSATGANTTTTTATIPTSTSDPNSTLGRTTSTVSGPLATAANGDVLADAPTTDSTPNSSPNRAWIAGAVIGPVMAIILIAVGVFLLRRRRKQKAITDDNNNGDLIGFKAQLHGDSIEPAKELSSSSERSPYHEADSTSRDNNSNSEPHYELPANEPPATEMMGGSKP